MKSLPSSVFPNCEFTEIKDAGFYDIIPAGFTQPVSLYLGDDTTKSDEAIIKAGNFFDNITKWDKLCKEMFKTRDKDSEDYDMIIEYFTFYQDEVPDVFKIANPKELSLEKMVNCLNLCQMASHGNGKQQYFTVDFTLGYDQLLCVYFNYDWEVKYLAWES